uniref:F-box domain-containing protein n=1 Tax=Tanacetum cinerariifolium TaxID=118510 RepID=A0A6L2P5U1_TANCI|nr:hypothetical protein [Tanacetum cinerariifolium]
MSQSYDDLPDEIWDIILTQLPNTHFESLSLVNKHLLSLTNHNRRNLTVTNSSYIIHNTLNHLLNRFNNLNSLNLSQLSHQNSFLTALTEITNSSLVNTLTSLDISNHDYVPVGLLIKLGQKCSLRVLICGNVVRLCDEDLRGIAKAFPYLEEVDLSCPSFKFAFREFGVYEIMITDEGIECLASGLRNLVRIDLSKNSLLTDKSIYCLSEKCVRLEEVVFVDCALITMKGVRFMLDNSRNVRMIGMSVVSGLHGNGSLFVDGVRSGRCLSELSFRDSDFSDEFLDGIVEARVPLKSVSFVDCNKYSIGGLLRLLHAYRLIKFLDLSRNYSLSDDSVIVLSECLRDLVTVKFNFCKLTSAALFALIENCLSLEHVELAHACLGKEEDVVMEVLKRPNLSIKYLNLSANSDMSDECLVKITSVCPNLKVLHVSSCSRITGSIGEILNNCREIRNLSIQDCGGVKNLGLRMKPLKLEKLYMGRSGVNNDGLREIAVRCNEIVNIDISGCQYVTTDAVIYMVKKCEKLREVNLMGCSNLNVYIVNWMVHTRPSLRKVIPPSYGVTTESQRLLMLHHGCQVADK